MSEENKCPKCGDGRRFNYESFFLFGCDTKVYRDGSGNVSQSAFCELSEQNTTLRASLSKAAEALRKDRSEWLEQVAAELLSGSVVKEAYARGRVNGIDVALQIVEALDD